VRDRAGKERTVKLPVTAKVDDAALVRKHLVGKPAPAFAASVAVGPPFTSLQALRGSWVLLDFWGTYCWPCVESIPGLHAFEKAVSGRVRVLGISNEEKRILASSAAKHHITHSLLIDRDSKIIGAYDTSSLPTMVLIDPEGVVRLTDVGGPTTQDTWDRMAALVRGER
jgi:peroxiredoxin